MNTKPEQLSPLTLAFIGDAVFELMVRQHVIKNGDKPVAALHKDTVGYVSAVAQSGKTERLKEILNDEEKNIFKRGRNVNNHVPKNVTPKDYRAATALEALFGYLYLKGKMDRLEQIFSDIIK